MSTPTSPNPASGQSLNLIPDTLEGSVNWSAKDADEILKKIYDFADGECTKAIAWYFSKKKRKATLGTAMRLLALIAVTIAGMIPVIGEILEDKETPWISPAWATIALAVAALLAGFDKFGGHTSGWVRYIRTATALSNLQRNFKMDWGELSVIPPEPKDPNGPPVHPLKPKFDLCRQFVTKMNELVSGETDEWVREFQSALGDFDKVSNQSPANRNGK